MSLEYFGTNLQEYGHYRWDLTNEKFEKGWIRFDDLPFNPERLTNDLPKGEVVFYQGEGFTVIGISGSCKDDRGGTKSIFWTKENLTKQQMIDKINNNKLAMTIINVLPFTVKWN